MEMSLAARLHHRAANLQGGRISSLSLSPSIPPTRNQPKQVDGQTNAGKKNSNEKNETQILAARRPRPPDHPFALDLAEGREACEENHEE